MWATKDPSGARDWFEAQTRKRPVFGGAHPGFGTRNDLIGIHGALQYIEIIYPDPDQSHTGTLADPMSKLTGGGIYHWAVASSDLGEIHSTATELGIRSSGVVKAARQTDDGSRLEWELVFLRDHGFGALMPFFIDWKDCPHPSSTLPAAGALQAFQLQSPNPGQLETVLKQLSVQADVEAAEQAGIHAELDVEGERITLPIAAPFTDGFVI